jgi:hypothetical protein
MKKLLIITPAYQEEENIESVINEVKKIRIKNVEIKHLIVNDGSTDKTAELAKKNKVKVIEHLSNKGYGRSIQTGYIFAAKNGYDFVLQIDADGQHIIDYAKEVLNPVLNNDADISIGTRMAKNPGYNIKFIRKSGIIFYSKLISLLIGQKISDCTSGFRAMNKKVFYNFAKKFPKKLCAIESLLWLGLRNFRIEEVSVSMNARNNGESYLRSITLLTYPIKMIFAILRAFR